MIGQNANLLLCIIGFAMLMTGLWQLGSHVAMIVGGCVILSGVAADVGLRAAGITRERDE